MLASRERRSETTSCRSRFRSSVRMCQEAGQLKLLISLTKWFKENHRTDSEQTEFSKSKTIHGWETSRGKIWMRRRCRHLSCLQKKITLTKRISTKSGVTLRTSSSNKTSCNFADNQSSPSSVDTTMTINFSNWLRTKAWLRLASPMLFCRTSKTKKCSLSKQTLSICPWLRAQPRWVVSIHKFKSRLPAN